MYGYVGDGRIGMGHGWVGADCGWIEWVRVWFGRNWKCMLGWDDRDGVRMVMVVVC